jgi:hypothetical protein
MAGVSRRGFRRGNADTLERKGQSGHHHYDDSQPPKKGLPREAQRPGSSIIKYNYTVVGRVGQCPWWDRGRVNPVAELQKGLPVRRLFPSKRCATLDFSRRLRMDGSVSPSDLYARLGTASAPLLIDVRPHDAFFADDRLIVGASIAFLQMSNIGGKASPPAVL